MTFSLGEKPAELTYFPHPTSLVLIVILLIPWVPYWSEHIFVSTPNG